MLLLISDANILIDVEAAELLETLFKLPYQFAIPDILYVEEIEPGTPGLERLGLNVLEVRPDFITEHLSIHTNRLSRTRVSAEPTTNLQNTTSVPLRDNRHQYSRPKSAFYLPCLNRFGLQLLWPLTLNGLDCCNDACHCARSKIDCRSNQARF